MPVWFAMAGFVAWPLTLVAIAVVLLILERLYVFFQLTPVTAECTNQSIADCHGYCRQGKCRIRQQGWHYGLSLLQQHRYLEGSERKEVLNTWLLEEKHRLTKHLSLLKLGAGISFLLGVLASLSAFISVLSDPFGVNMLLLAQALYPSVFGLSIAIVAFAAGAGGGVFVAGYLDRVRVLLEQCHLALEGSFLKLLDDEDLELAA
ncbi:hypothetical protein VQ643_13090 [Pseudomonas sp. F1_0610]|uniref:hypothetical protein n=1 Tax=Pseudomonas sp. F1_0610 TaxID=3114284 RepID=UPI0039C181A6